MNVPLSVLTPCIEEGKCMSNWRSGGSQLKADAILLHSPFSECPLCWALNCFWSTSSAHGKQPMISFSCQATDLMAVARADLQIIFALHPERPSECERCSECKSHRSVTSHKRASAYGHSAPGGTPRIKALQQSGRLTAGQIRGSEAHQCQKRPPGGLPSAPQSCHAPYDPCPGR